MAATRKQAFRVARLQRLLLLATRREERLAQQSALPTSRRVPPR